MVLKDPCSLNDDNCDHFGANMENVLFSDQALESFPQDENEAPFNGEYKPVQVGEKQQQHTLATLSLSHRFFR